VIIMSFIQLCELPTRSGIDSLPDNLLLCSLIETIESRTPWLCDWCHDPADTDTKLSSVGETGRNVSKSAQSGTRKSTKIDGRHGAVDAGSPAAARVSTHCCIKCEEFLCKFCVRQHRQGRTTADHLVVSVSAMKEVCQVRIKRHLIRYLLDRSALFYDILNEST